MDFYDRVDDMYVNMVQQPLKLWRVKLELLDHFENTVMCIEKDIDYGNAGSITCNNVQGTRKSCSITLINVDLKYIPTEDSPFWFNRKFRLYIGLVDNRHYKQGDTDVHWTNETDTYWFSKGVYITQDIHVDSASHTVSISGVDKYAQLDGTLNVLQADEMNTVFEYGAPIKDVIQDILTLDMGNGNALDPITPMIDDTSLNTISLYKEFTLSAGQYYGDFLNELATSYGAEVFYDNIGRLVFRRLFSDDFPYWIGFKAPALEVKYHFPGYQNPQETVKLNGVNKIIVSTDNVETPNASYTAKNTNPRSPLCYNKIGARTFPENGGIVIINAGNIVTEEDTERDPTLHGESEELVRKRCRDYAEYRLMQETCLGTTISFNYAPYLHLNEGDVIAITDPDFALDCDLYIINSITFPLGADSIQLEVSNLGFLNSDISSQTQYSGLTNQPIKFGIHYITGEVLGTPPANQLVEIGQDFIAANDYNEETHYTLFDKINHELISWTDNINGDTYIPGESYPVPHQYFTMTANWANYEDYVMHFKVKDIAGAGYLYNLPIIVNDYPTALQTFSVAFIIINGEKYYYWGRNYEAKSTISVEMESSEDLKCVFVPKNDSATLDLDYLSAISGIVFGGLAGGKNYYIKYPDILEDVQIIGSISYAETIILSKKARNVFLYGGFSHSYQTVLSNFKALEFNNDYPITVNVGQYNGQCFFPNAPIIENVSANGHVDFVCSYLDGSNYYSYIFGGITEENVSVPNITFAKGVKVYNTVRPSDAQVQLHFFHYMRSIKQDMLATVEIGNDTDTVYASEYEGGLDLTDTLMFADNGGSQQYLKLNLQLGNVRLDNSTFLSSCNIHDITLNGNIFINNSSLLSNSQFDNTTLEMTGEKLYLKISPPVSSMQMFSNTDFITGTNLTSLIIHSDITIDDTEVVSRGQIAFCQNNSALTMVKMYGAFNVNVSDDSTYSYIFNSNSLLTDLYFYDDDNFSITSSGNRAFLFTNNNANFKIHGIAGGNVEAYCTAHSIPFEVIVNE